MKKIIFLILSFAICSSIKAQEELHRLLHPNSSKTPKTEVKKGNVSKEITDGLFIISQEYQLHDQKEDIYYGFDEADEFGPIFSIGFFYKNCYMMNDMGFHPWVYDANYEEFANDENLKPVREKTRYMILADLESTRFRRENFNTEEPIEIKENSAYLYTTFRSTQKGFEIDNALGEKNGVVVWVLNTSDSHRQVVPSFEIMDFAVDDTEDINIKAPQGKVIGGVYLIESGDSYMVAGFTNKKDGRWTLEFPFVGLNLDDVNAEISESDK